MLKKTPEQIAAEKFVIAKQGSIEDIASHISVNHARACVGKNVMADIIVALMSQDLIDIDKDYWDDGIKISDILPHCGFTREQFIKRAKELKENGD